MQGGIYFVIPEQLMGDKIEYVGVTVRQIWVYAFVFFISIAWFGTFVAKFVAVGANEADYDPQIFRAAKESPENF